MDVPSDWINNVTICALDVCTLYKKQQVLTDGRRKKTDERITLKATESNSMKKGEEREKENTCPASKRSDIMSDSFQPAELQQGTLIIYTYNKI